MIFSTQVVSTARVRRNRVYTKLRAESDGMLYFLRFDSDTFANTDVSFDVLVNGVTIYETEDDRPVMLEGTKSIEQMPNGVELEKGDLVEFVAHMQGPYVTVGYQLYTTIQIDDGTDAGPPGPAGKTIIYGSAAPTTEGVDGDTYIRTTTNFIYGPKAGGVWPVGTSLIGPKGDDGEPGTDGVDGQDGADGSPGDIATTGLELLGPDWARAIAIVKPPGFAVTDAGVAALIANYLPVSADSNGRSEYTVDGQPLSGTTQPYFQFESHAGWKIYESEGGSVKYHSVQEDPGGDALHPVDVTTWYADDNKDEPVPTLALSETDVLAKVLRSNLLIWGQIRGDILNQTDLQATLALKANLSESPKQNVASADGNGANNSTSTTFQDSSLIVPFTASGRYKIEVYAWMILTEITDGVQVRCAYTGTFAGGSAGLFMQSFESAPGVNYGYGYVELNTETKVTPVVSHTGDSNVFVFKLTGLFTPIVTPTTYLSVQFAKVTHNGTADTIKIRGFIKSTQIA